MNETTATTATPQQHQGSLVKMDTTGDSVTCWDTAAPETVTLAERAFNDLRAMGYAAFQVGSQGSDGTLIKRFDPLAERIVLTPPLAGG